MRTGTIRGCLAACIALATTLLGVAKVSASATEFSLATERLSAAALLALTNRGVDVHCVGLALPVNFTPVLDVDGVSEDPLWEATDPAPVADEVCFLDEATADQFAEQSGVRIGKVYTDTNFKGSSKNISVPREIDSNDNGCLDGEVFGKRWFGPNFKDNVESAKGFKGCNVLTVYNYKNFKGQRWGRVLDNTNLGEANNKNGSIALAP